MKIVAISDTHTKHNHLKLPKGDMLIHAGDISSGGTESEVKNFLHWFGSQDFKYKVLIAGNHDFFFEARTPHYIASLLPKGVIYLNDEGVTIEGINIWGSPVQPWFYNWAFNRQRGKEINQHWKLIPQNTDILITHGPTFGILDKTTRGEQVGCEDLKNMIDKIQPKFHICGHIHEAYGIEKVKNTTYINASVLNERYELVNKAIEFEI